MIIRIAMMQKDEAVLLRPWIDYHSALVGARNLTIFDNGSSDPGVLGVLDAAEGEGVEVIRDYPTFEHFSAKGTLIADRIKAFDRDDPADFYFPLDCDEFLVAQRRNDTIATDTAGLEEALRPHLGAPEVLRIGFGFDNDPREKGRFFPKGRAKSFFAMNACDHLDLGFHRARARSTAETQIVDVGYLHLHNKPLPLLQDGARQKMLGRVADFSRETLIAHREARGQGFHLINELLFETEEEYFDFVREKYAKAQAIHFPGFLDRMTALNTEVPY